jgi:amino acid transporter
MVFLVTVSLLLTYLNYRGLNVVGQTAMTTTLFIIMPFVLLCILAAPHVEPTNWLQVGGDLAQQRMSVMQPAVECKF